MHQVNQLVRQQGLHAAAQLGHDSLLAGHRGPEVKRIFSRTDPECLRCLHLLQHFRAPAQGLGGDTALVQAGAAHRPGLDQCNRFPASCGQQGGLVTARACTNYYNI